MNVCNLEAVADSGAGQNISCSDREWLRQSSLYRELSAERDEILRLKWLESEKRGFDIGFDLAVTSWVRQHCGLWRAARRSDRRCG